MTTLTLRSYHPKKDLQRLVDFINLCEAHDQIEQGATADELQHALQHPDIDPEHGVLLWEDADGLVAYGQLEISCHQAIDALLRFRVRPDARNEGLEEQVLAWAEQRTRLVASTQAESLPTLLRTFAIDKDIERHTVLERTDLKPDRFFRRLARPLDDEIPAPVLPEGYRLRTFAGENEIGQWVEMFNQSFIDHWNHHDLTIENMRFYLNDPLYRPDLDLLVEAPDGTLAAFCCSSVNPRENARTGYNRGHVDVLGTRRGYRRLGLARALLLEALRRLQADGRTQATIGVDAHNPSEAYRLYEGVGFLQDRDTTVYVKQLA